MQLVSIQMRGIIATDFLFILKRRYYGPKEDILDHRGIFLFWYYILLYPFQGYMVQRFEIVDMKKTGYDSIDSVYGITNPNKYCGTNCIGLDTSVSFLW